ncbi:MAG: LCP family protein [Clostridia bacterium]|nr:LCP family protein [Clostridia bacterium]
MRACRMIAALALLVMLLTAACPAAAYTARHPLLTPVEVTPAETQDEYTNILLLGLDYGPAGRRGSHNKARLQECHADAVLLVSLNRTKNTVNLVSLPRDTLTYVPGVRGLYKLNAAVNCADTLEEGFERACDAASWLLGGVEVSLYCAVDMQTMEALGDAIGGVEFEMDMIYTGHHGRVYQRGWQTLDGEGIMDYLRARRNATIDGTDIGRTGRHRELMLAIFKKIRGNPQLMGKILPLITDGDSGIMTNIGFGEITSLVSLALTFRPEEIGSYVMTGPYGTELDGWNFTFTDQQARIDLIRALFGVEAQELPHVSRPFCRWLMETGYLTLCHIRAAQQAADYAQGCALNEEQQAQLDELRTLIDLTCERFDIAAEAMGGTENSAMGSARLKMRETAKALLESLGYDEPVRWGRGAAWYEDTRINEYVFQWQ